MVQLVPAFGRHISYLNIETFAIFLLPASTNGRMHGFPFSAIQYPLQSFNWKSFDINIIFTWSPGSDSADIRRCSCGCGHRRTVRIFFQIFCFCSWKYPYLWKDLVYYFQLTFIRLDAPDSAPHSVFDFKCVFSNFYQNTHSLGPSNLAEDLRIQKFIINIQFI